MKNCMYCEEKKCVCKNIQRINKMKYDYWGTWIKKMIYKENNLNTI